MAKSVQFDARIEPLFYPSGQVQSVRVESNVENHTDEPLMVLDAQTQAAFVIDGEGALTILHDLPEARALSAVAPQPTYARRVMPGENVQSTHSANLLSAYPHVEAGATQLIAPTRVRYCVAAAPFASEHFLPASEDEAIWLVQVGARVSLQRLCSRWAALTPESP